MLPYLTSVPGFFPPFEDAPAPSAYWLLGSTCRIEVDRSPTPAHGRLYRGLLRGVAGETLRDFPDAAFVTEPQPDGSGIVWFRAHLPACNWSGLATLEVWRGLEENAAPLKTIALELRQALPQG